MGGLGSARFSADVLSLALEIPPMTPRTLSLCPQVPAGLQLWKHPNLYSALLWLFLFPGALASLLDQLGFSGVSHSSGRYQQVVGGSPDPGS